MEKQQHTLNLPFRGVEPLEIKAAIVEKFGSLSQFCRITGRSIHEINVRFRNKTEPSLAYLEKAFADAKTHCNQPANGYHLTALGREKIKSALGQYPTVVAFCQQHPAFSSVFISRITGGGTAKITAKVRHLAETLNIELTKPDTGTRLNVQ